MYNFSIVFQILWIVNLQKLKDVIIFVYEYIYF